MDTYDDYCWFPEPSLSTGSAAKRFEISGNNAQHIDHHHHQTPSTGSYSSQQPFHHHQHHNLARGHHGGRQAHHHQSPQIVVNSALSSPSSGYCSSEDCPGGFPPTFGGAVGFYSPRGVGSNVGDKQLNDSTKPFVGSRLLQSPASTSLSSSSSSLVGSGSTSPWQVASPTGILTSSDPCLGQQAVHSIQQQQKLHHSNFTASQTMHQEFVDDYGAAWSGAIGFDDLEALWDPFGATASDRMAPIRHQRITDMAPFETVSSPSAATTCRGTVGVERMDSSSYVKDQNFFGQYHHHGLAFTPNTSVGSGGEHSYVGIAASAIASQNGVGDRFATTGSGFDDGTPVDYGFCMSSNGMATGVLGETSLINMLQRDAYLSSASLSVGCGTGYGLGSSSVSGDLDNAAASSGTVGQFQQISADNSSFFSHQSSNGTRLGARSPSSSALLHDSDVMVGGGSVAGYHLQHMAADMATGCDDTDDFDMFHRFVDGSVDKGRTLSDGRGIMSGISSTSSGSSPNAVDSSKASWDGQCETIGVRGKPGSALFSGVFGQRRTVTPDTGNMAFPTAKAVGPAARSRGLTVAKSCGSLLQIAPTYGPTGKEPTSGNDSLVLQPTGNSRPRGANGAARSSAAGCARLDVRGGRSSTAANANCVNGTSSSSLYPGLDDHRYTTKAMPTVQVYPPTKVQKTHRNGFKQSASTGRLNHSASSSVAGTGGNNNTSVLGSRSILEAFLRSTRPMDPNKGSNAALAAEGLLHLHIGDRSPRKHRSLRSTSSSDADEDDDQQSGTLLKKLLTGELDQSDFQRGRDRSSLTRRHGGNGKRNCLTAEKSSTRKQTFPRAPPPSREEVIDDSLASSLMPVDIDFSTVEQNDGLDPVTAMVNSRLSIGNSHDDLVGLGIDMDLSLLDDPACMAIFGMIEDADVDDYGWMSATAAAAAAGDCCDLDDKISSTALDEILREGLRHGIDNPWHQQYADETHAGPGGGDAIGAV